MNILFLTLVKIDDVASRGIYNDLMRELANMGNKVYIASPTERRFGKNTHIIDSGNIQILKIKTLNIQKTNVIEKGIGTLLLERQFLKALKKYWGDIKFDLILYSTPPITFNRVIEYFKDRNFAKTYLLLKDIFPQNAVDLGMFKKDSFLYQSFRKKEEKLYQLSDRIGCMSPANVDFIISHNPSVNPEKIEIFPNSLIPLKQNEINIEDRNNLLKNFGIDYKKVISLYGGNLGKPQGIDFLLEVLEDNEKKSNHHIIIVGDGTEYQKVQQWFEENKPKNATLLARLPQNEYEKLARSVDIGLIFLDHRFTIPNYPSRLLSYIENSIPVMIASDINTDQGRIAEEKGFGYWCESNDVTAFSQKIDDLIKNPERRKEMGINGRVYFEHELDVRNHIEKLFFD